MKHVHHAAAINGQRRRLLVCIGGDEVLAREAVFWSLLKGQYHRIEEFASVTGRSINIHQDEEFSLESTDSSL